MYLAEAWFATSLCSVTVKCSCNCLPVMGANWVSVPGPWPSTYIWLRKTQSLIPFEVRGIFFCWQNICWKTQGILWLQWTLGKLEFWWHRDVNTQVKLSFRWMRVCVWGAGDAWLSSSLQAHIWKAVHTRTLLALDCRCTLQSQHLRGRRQRARSPRGAWNLEFEIANIFSHFFKKIKSFYFHLILTHKSKDNTAGLRKPLRHLPTPKPSISVSIQLEWLTPREHHAVRMTEATWAST